MKTQNDLFCFLKQLNIETDTHQHPALHTVEEAQQYTSNIPGGHCKNLFLRDAKKRSFFGIVAIDNTQAQALAIPIGT